MVLQSAAAQKPPPREVPEISRASGPVFVTARGCTSERGSIDTVPAGHRTTTAPMFPNKPTNAALAATARRQREDDAPRLAAVIPDLTALAIRVDERSMISAPTYTRRFVVDQAPAVFIIPCSDPNCGDGGHDISSEVLAALRGRKVRFDGSHLCTGWLGSKQCERTIWFEGEAEYTRI